MTLITFLHIQRDKINVFVKSNTAETRLHCMKYFAVSKYKIYNAIVSYEMRRYKSNSELDICITQFNVFIEFVNLVELRQHRLILSLLTSKQQRSHHSEFDVKCLA